VSAVSESHFEGSAGNPKSRREHDLEARIRHLEVVLAQSQQASRRLEREADADPLTGLANHRALHDRLRTEVERAQRYGRPLSLAYLDVDGFKDVNDHFGHQVGDKVLSEVGARLNAVARSADLVARIGGDEFAVLLPETTAEAAEAVARRAHELIRVDLAGPGPSVTVSIGICDLEHASSAHALVGLADSALYRAKDHGRDAVWRYRPETVEDASQDDRAARLARHQTLGGIRALARAVDAKDHSTHLHSERVANLSRSLAVALGWSAHRAEALHETALVHDVGKLAIPNALLFTRRRLTAAEYETVKTHATLGAQIAGEALNDEQLGWLRGHHERVDGNGYPDGLAGEAVPDGARLLALADSWDVMTSDRPYSRAMQLDEALEECRRCTGSQFFAEPVDVLVAPRFERTRRILANEQAACSGDESSLADEAPRRLTLRCECGTDDCTAQVTLPAREYRAVRAHDRRYVVRRGHEVPSDALVQLATAGYSVLEQAREAFESRGRAANDSRPRVVPT
jgi:diguanylate cyclase (GGDEF)-like protein